MIGEPCSLPFRESHPSIACNKIQMALTAFHVGKFQFYKLQLYFYMRKGATAYLLPRFSHSIDRTQLGTCRKPTYASHQQQYEVSARCNNEVMQYSTHSLCDYFHKGGESSTLFQRHSIYPRQGMTSMHTVLFRFWTWSIS